LEYIYDSDRLKNYCKEKGIKSHELTIVERKKFVVSEDRKYTGHHVSLNSPCAVCSSVTFFRVFTYNLPICSDVCYQRFLDERDKKSTLYIQKKKAFIRWMSSLIADLFNRGYSRIGIYERVELDKADIDLVIDNHLDLTTLDDAIENDDFNKVKEIVSKNPGVVEARDKYGYTPLIYAASCSKFCIAKWLIEKGADINVRANGGQNALMWAFHFGNVEFIIHMIEKGVDLNLLDDDGEFVLITIVNNWLNNDSKCQLLDLIKEYEVLLNPKTKKEFHKSRLKILFKSNDF